MKNFKKVKADTLAHYDRMIAWAETQPPEERKSSTQMEEAINEDWSGENCPMCQACTIDGSYISCALCPISATTGERGCCGTPWQNMCKADTWGEWLVAAKKERAFLAALTNHPIRRK